MPSSGHFKSYLQNYMCGWLCPNKFYLQNSLF
jgi:hypothetical protein